MRQNIEDLDILRTPAEPLEFLTGTGMDTAEGTEIIDELIKAMNEDETIIALSAPQIGIKKRIFGIRFNDTIKVFINPIITKKSGSVIAPETFVNMPGKEILISRPEEITAVYYTNDFKYEDNKLIGPAARLFAQQVELLDGVLPSDLGLVSDVEADGSLADLSEEEIAQVQEIYKQFITAKIAAMEKDIANDEQLQKQYNSLKFTESVINGRTQIVDNRKKPTSQTMAEASQRKAENQHNLKKFLNRKK